ncbi:MAG: hypothetical protein ACYS47_10715 [Planctomycetota bacterium]|jgi:hypothetical protein
MAQGSFGSYHVDVAEDELKALRSELVRFLERDGYQIRRKGLAKGTLRIEGIRGSSLVAVLMQMLPFMDILGFGSRVKTTIVSRKSLTKGDDSRRLTVRCAPLKELMNEEEQFLISQDVGERMGDNLQCSRCLKRISGFLAQAGYI